MRAPWLLVGLVLLFAACGDSADFVDDTGEQVIVEDDSGQSVTTPPGPDDPVTGAPETTEPAATTEPPTTSEPPPLTLITQPPDKEPPPASLPSGTLPPPTGDVPVPEPGGPVEHARADLASRLGIAVEDVTVVRAGEVTWRDGSLGCPQPGMAYTQALVNGMQILLDAGGQTYAYHAGGTGAPFSCATPQEPLPPDAGGFGDS